MWCTVDSKTDKNVYFICKAIENTCDMPKCNHNRSFKTEKKGGKSAQDFCWVFQIFRGKWLNLGESVWIDCASSGVYRLFEPQSVLINDCLFDSRCFPEHIKNTEKWKWNFIGIVFLTGDEGDIFLVSFSYFRIYVIIDCLVHSSLHIFYLINHHANVFF